MFQQLRVFSAVLLMGSFAFAASPVRADQNSQSQNGAHASCENLEPVRVHGTIVDVAVGNPAFSTLVTTLSATNLVTTLQGKGPFTVFAPTNAAFGEIPAPVLNYLLANTAVLKSVLLYHVAAGAKHIDCEDEAQVIGTIQGEKVFARASVHGESATLSVNNSTVILRPIRADNGIIYVIDSVLLPQFK